MCKPISAIILKDRILFSNVSHSHSDILQENGINDTSITPNFVKVELSPENGDMFSDPATWQYATDQDTFPDWYVAEVDEMRLREAAAVYIKDHIHIGINNLVLSDGLHWLKNCKNVVLKGSASVSELINSTVEEMYGNSTVKTMHGYSTVEEMYGNSTVKEMCDNSTVEKMYDSSTVKTMCDNSTVETMCGSSTVKTMCDNSTVETMCDSSTVEEMYGNSTVKTMYGNSTVKDYRTKTIYQSGQSGDWKLVIVSPKDDSNE